MQCFNHTCSCRMCLGFVCPKGLFDPTCCIISRIASTKSQLWQAPKPALRQVWAGYWSQATSTTLKKQFKKQTSATQGLCGWLQPGLSPKFKASNIFQLLTLPNIPENIIISNPKWPKPFTKAFTQLPAEKCATLVSTLLCSIKPSSCTASWPRPGRVRAKDFKALVAILGANNPVPLGPSSLDWVQLKYTFAEIMIWNQIYTEHEWWIVFDEKMYPDLPWPCLEYYRVKVIEITTYSHWTVGLCSPLATDQVTRVWTSIAGHAQGFPADMRQDGQPCLVAWPLATNVAAAKLHPYDWWNGAMVPMTSQLKYARLFLIYPSICQLNLFVYPSPST